MSDNKSHFESNQTVGELLQNNLVKHLKLWPMYIVLVIVGLGLSWAYLQYATPIYQSTAKIVIKDPNKGIDDSKFLESINLLDSKKIVENEVEVIQSATLANEVVKKLHLYAPISKEGKFKDVSAYTSSPVTIEVADPEKIAGTKKIKFSFNSNTKLVSLESKEVPLNEWINFANTKLRFINNPNYIQDDEESDFCFSLQNTYGVAGGILGNLKVVPASKVSTVIYLTYDDANPVRAAEILNQLIQEYNNSSVNEKNRLATNTLSFVEDRLNFIVGELDSIESRIQQFKTKKGIVDISAQGKQFLETVGTNDLRVSELNVQLAVLDQVEEYVLGKGGRGSLVPSTLGVNDPVLTQLLDRLYASEMEYESLRKTTAPKNPILLSLQDQINKIKPGILENINNQRKNLQAGKSNINSSNSKYSTMLRSIPQNERELLDISRQQIIKNNIYTFLLQKREETALAYASGVTDSRLIDKAHVSYNPISPNKRFVFLSAILAALFIGMGVITIRDLFNQKVKSKEEIESMTDAPVIAELLYDGSGDQIVVGNGVQSFLAEQFRHLRTTLGFLGIGTNKKRILVTSSVSGEGKSFISINLGIGLSLAEKKVVLIELDLRQPKMSKLIQRIEFGASDFLAGKCNIEDVIQSTSINENFYVIQAGDVPENPSELLLSEKMNVLIDYCTEKFDYVIVDTAPVSPVTDAYILSPKFDTTLYVVRNNYTPISYVRSLDQRIKVKGLKNTAIVFNGIRYGDFSKYEYSYGYPSKKGVKRKINKKSSNDSYIKSFSKNA